MKKWAIALVGLGLSFNLFAAQVDLESVMKEMRTEYKHAYKADTVEEMQAAVNRLDELVIEAKSGHYSPKRNELYQQGFDKLLVSFKSIDEALAQNDLELAKSELAKVNSLKKEYHKKAKNLK